MKPIIAFLLLLPAISYGQKTALVFRSALNNVPIPFVTIYSKGKAQAADSNGRIILWGNKIEFSSSHVSFRDTSISIQHIETDTTFIVFLNEKIEALGDLKVQASEKYNSKKYVKHGNAQHKSNYIIGLHSNLKIGIFYKANNQAVGKYLRSLQVKVQNAKELSTQHFPLEVKIFRIRNGLIDSVPINRKQIIIISNRLKALTEIMVDQRIKIPTEGLFFSLELPPVFSDAITTANFYATFDYDYCNFFVANNSRPYWDPSLLYNNCILNDKGKAKNLIHSITYFVLK